MAKQINAGEIAGIIRGALDNWDFSFARADARAILYDMAANPTTTAEQLNDYLTTHNTDTYTALEALVAAAP